MTSHQRLASIAALFVASLSSGAPAVANSVELADNYRRANDSQRLAYMEQVITQSRFGSNSAARIRALAAVAKACVDDWDPKLEEDFAAQVGACIVMANRRVGGTP